MNQKRFSTALIGFGRIAQGYADDKIMARHFRYATHAQVLANHEKFSWEAVVDEQEIARQQARNKWKVSHTAPCAQELANCNEIEVAVLATPPESRLGILNAFPNLKAVLVEKPLGQNLKTAESFLCECNERNILVQVNLIRRADVFTRKLAAGGLSGMIGDNQAAYGLYCNGLLNNGTHMVDLVRMLLGEIVSIQAFSQATSPNEAVSQEINFPFVLQTQSNIFVAMYALELQFYRENALDIWGSRGRFAYMHGGLTLLEYAKKANRMVCREQEIAVDKPKIHQPTIGQALYEMYSNLAAALAGKEELLSSGESALVTAKIIDTLLHSRQQGGSLIRLSPDRKQTSKARMPAR